LAVFLPLPFPVIFKESYGITSSSATLMLGKADAYARTGAIA